MENTQPEAPIQVHQRYRKVLLDWLLRPDSLNVPMFPQDIQRALEKEGVKMSKASIRTVLRSIHRDALIPKHVGTRPYGAGGNTKLIYFRKHV